MGEYMVSVCCTTFNHAKYIRKALDGCLMQKTSFPFEIVVHDDASTDGTADILREYDRNHPGRFHLILQKENQYSQGHGPSEFINPALTGKYIALCEGDDYWTDSNKLQMQVDYMEAHPECSLTAHQAIRINEQGDYIRPYSEDPNREDYDMDFPQVLGDLSRFPTASMVFRQDFFQIHQELLTRIPHFDYAYKLLCAGDGSVHVFARSMSAYRMAAKGSWTERMAKDNQKYIQHLQAAARTYEAIDAHFEGRFSQVMTPEIRSRWAQAFECAGNRAALLEPEYRPYYDRLSRSSKRSLWLRWYLPWVYRLVKRG